MPTVAVVGGGPAGLAAAFRLSQSPDTSVLLLERAPVLGGLAAGFQHGPYTLDFGPHRLHQATDPMVLADLKGFLGSDLRLRRRHGRLRLHGRYLPYPVGPRTLLGMEPRLVTAFARGALAARLRRSGARPDSYQAALSARLGAPLYDTFYGPYAEKVWGRPGTQIDVDQAERRVNQRGLLDLARLALGGGPGRSFFYPSGGFGRIPAAYEAALAACSRVRVVRSATVQQVSLREGRVASIAYLTEDGAVLRDVEHLVWTAPVPDLVRVLDPEPSDAVRHAAAGLAQRAVVLAYVALDRPQVGAADTYYFPERRFPFNRVIEQKNFGEHMIPANRTVLGLDLACDRDDAVYNASDEELARLVLPALEEAGLAQPRDVLEVFSRRFGSAYPIYGLGYAQRQAPAFTWLGRLPNLWLLGRQGLYLHNNTHHSLLMGYHGADAIQQQTRSAWPTRLAEFATFRVAD